MKYILSPYTYIFFDEDKYFLFNTQSLLFTEISKGLYCALNSEALDIELIKNAQFLIEKKVIIQEEYKEQYFYSQKIKSYQKFLSPELLDLVILPTSSCNFACPYCYEKDKENYFMTDNTINKLIEFIKSHELAENLNITWFGGEPLLGFHIIKKILAKIESEVKIPILKHSIITNGYLLTDEVITFFKTHKLNKIQITLDGEKESHNQTRKLKASGKPTYDRILNNIHKIKEKWPETKVTIRVNIKAEESEKFINIYERLEKEFGKETYIYPGFIRIDNKEKTNFDCGTLMKDKEQELSFKMYELGIDDECLPKHIQKGCMANCINHYIIGVKGEIYKCWNDVGDISKIVGYIDKEELSNIDLFSKYVMRSSIFEDEKCKDCLFFPICSGGCSWYRLRNIFENGKYNICAIQKENDLLKKILLSRYHKILQNKENH